MELSRTDFVGSNFQAFRNWSTRVTVKGQCMLSARKWRAVDQYPASTSGALISAAPVLCDSPEAEVSEELCERGGLVVGIEAAGVGKDPSVAAAERVLLQADAGVFDAGDDAVGADADEGYDGGTPAFDFGFEALAAGAKFVVGELISAGGGALDNVGDTELEVEKEGSFKGRKEPRGEAAAVESGPKTIAGPAKVATDRRGVQTRVDASEKDDQVFGDKVRYKLVMRGEDLSFGGLPGSGQCPFDRVASLERILLAVRRLRKEESPSTFSSKGSL
jgi:hypothetical protein